MFRKFAMAFCLVALWLSLPLAVRAADPFAPYWVQNHRLTQLWSGPNQDAASFGTVPAWSYFQVMEPQRGTRLHVLDARTGNFAYLDAADVGPSGPPPAVAEADPAEDAADSFLQSWWVVNHTATPLWSGPDEAAVNLGLASEWNFFEVLEPQAGSRLRVREPRSQGEAYLEAAAVGPTGAPEQLADPTQWWGYVGTQEVNVRTTPTTRDGKPIGVLSQGTPVLVRRWVAGETVALDDSTWAELADGTYLWAPLLRQATAIAPPLPAPMLQAEKWIDVNLTFQTVAAYEGEALVYWAPTSSGRPGWETPTGQFAIGRRVEKEVMDSNTLLGKDAQRAEYRVENVRWTQYFTGGGNALHENYWKDADAFGVPSSHGCLGLRSGDAQWFWQWAAIGTPLFIHY